MPLAIGFSVKPNPAREGGNIEITGAPNQLIVVSAPGRSSKFRLDKNGKATVPVPVEAGRTFTVGDGKWPRATEITVRVISSFR